MQFLKKHCHTVVTKILYVSSATIVPDQTGHLGAFRVNYSYVSIET